MHLEAAAQKLHSRMSKANPTQNAFVESFNGKFREYAADLYADREQRAAETARQLDTLRQ